MGFPIVLFLAAARAGGIFGDHASPVSDTTIVSSPAAATNHIARVRTQLPNASLAGGVAIVCFAVTRILIREAVDIVVPREAPTGPVRSRGIYAGGAGCSCASRFLDFAWNDIAGIHLPGTVIRNDEP